MRRLILTGLVLLFAPIGVSASALVEIAEIAWMGTVDSSANEWIELANTGSSPVLLDGWTLTALDGSPTIALSGTIGASARYLIERTDDETVPGVPADLVAAFGAGISNTGETFTLRDATGAIVDTVQGGENWTTIGGSNSSKETPQRTASGWVTAPATPRAAPSAQTPATASTSASAASTGSSNGGAASSGSASSARSIFPRPGIGVHAGDDTRTFVGFPARFEGSATGLYDEAIPQATYRWNFGDGTTGVGASVEHAYRFAGEYVVTLEVFWGTYRASDRAIATVSAPELRIVRAVPGAEGYIELSNTSASEIDLSRWSLSVPEVASSFVFPDQTFVRAGKSVLYANDTTKLAFDPVHTIELRYPNGALAAAYRAAAPSTPVAPARISSAPRQSSSASSSPAVSAPTTRSHAEPMGVKTHAPIPTKTVKPKDVSSLVQNASAAALWEEGIEALSPVPESPSVIPIGTQWFFALAGVILIALAGFIIARTKIDQATRVDEYAIIEDIIEGKGDVGEKPRV